MMRLFCFDLEGVFTPEIWIEVSRRFKIPSLRLTTRDIPDYDKLMKYRLKILRKEKIKLRDIQKVIAGMKPLAGARAFLDQVRALAPVIILSDTYLEFAGPLLQKLDHPTLLCNWLKTDRAGYISNYILRQRDGKRKAVEAFKRMGFKITAVGDSYNDLGMLRIAHRGIFFRAPESITKKNRKFHAVETYRDLLKILRYNKNHF